VIRIVLDIVAELFQRVPEKARGYVYLVLVVGGLIYIAVTAWRSGFTVDQLVALLFSIVGGLANSNRPTVKARTTARRRPTNNQE
jgi:hypothetical protein